MLRPIFHAGGGPTAILAWAGKDATKFFNEIHKGVKSHGFDNGWDADMFFLVSFLLKFIDILEKLSSARNKNMCFFDMWKEFLGFWTL